MSDNPYQTPEVSDAPVAYDPLQAILPNVPRIEFQTTVTADDQRDALLRTSFRPQLQRWGDAKKHIKQGLVVLLFAFVSLLSVLSVLTGDGYALLLIPAIMMFFLCIGIWSRRVLLQQLIRQNGRSLGTNSGFIDQKYFFVRNDRRAVFSKLESLVIAAANERRIVLCFDPLLNSFATIAFDAFSDPHTMQRISNDLVQGRPKAKQQANIELATKFPEDDPLFEPASDAIHYSGAILKRDLQGSKLEADMGKARWRSLAFVLFILTVLLGGLYLAIGFTWWLLVMVALPAIIFAGAIYRQLRMQGNFRNDDSPIIQTKGWIEEAGVVTISHSQQDSADWNTYDTHEITSDAILLRWKELQLWSVISRSQVAQSKDWKRACELVRSKVSAM